MAARVALGKIKNDSGFIECIFAAKTARELPQEEVTVSDSKPSDSGPLLRIFLWRRLRKRMWSSR